MADVVADMKVCMVADMKVYIVPDMKVDMVPDMKVDMVANFFQRRGQFMCLLQLVSPARTA